MSWYQRQAGIFVTVRALQGGPRPKLPGGKRRGGKAKGRSGRRK